MSGSACVALSVNSSTLVASGNVAAGAPGGLCLLPARSVAGSAISLATPCCSPLELNPAQFHCRGVTAEASELDAGPVAAILAAPILEGLAVGAVRVASVDRDSARIRLLLARAQELAGALAPLVQHECSALLQDMEKFVLAPLAATAPTERVAAPERESGASCKPDDFDREDPGGAAAAPVLQPAEAAGRPAACAAAPPPPQPPQAARVRPQAPAARAGSRGEEPAAGCDAEAARRRGRRLLSVDSSRSAGDPGERASSGTGAAGESAGWRASVAGAHAPGGAAEAGLDQMMAGLQPAGAARGKAWPAPAGGAAGRDGGQGKSGFWQPPMAGSSEAKLSLLGKADRDEARRAGGAKSPARGSLFWLRFKDAALERQYTRYLSEQQLQIDVYGLVILQLVHGVLLMDAARANAMIQSLYVFAFEAVIVSVALTIRFARRWYKAHREPVQVASQAALTAAACCLLARPLAATLPAAGARSMFWFARCVFAEMLGSHAIMFVMRFWIAVPLRVALTALAAVSLPTACGKYRPVFPSDAGCWAGGLALQWGVGFALPMSIIWALERRSRRCFSAQAA